MAVNVLRFPDSQLQLHCSCIYLYPSVSSILPEHTDKAITFPSHTGIHLPADRASHAKSMKSSQQNEMTKQDISPVYH